MSYQRLFGTGRPAGDGSGSNSDLPDLLALSSSSDCDDSDGSDSNSDALSDLIAMSSSSDCDDLDTDGRCSRARAPLCYIRRVDTFKRVAETRPRLANVAGKGRFSLVDFLPDV